MSLRSTLQVVLLFVLGFQLSLAFAKPAFHNQQLTQRSPTGTSEFLTNAQRLAAGFPPLPPKRRFSPTKVELAARSAPSPTLYSGSIRIRDYASPQAPQGWVSKTSAAGNTVRLTPGNGDRLLMSFTYFAPDRAFEVAISDNDNFHFLGAVGGGLTSSAPTRNNLVRTNSATPNSGPQNVGNAVGGTSESYIWKFNPTTSEFSGVWSNGPNNDVPVYFYLTTAPPQRILSISANPNLTGSTKVRLFLDV
ncbi:hypothetical protein BKA70DRAFT_1255468 [Coprinopsis sp. MPI-PUGE-AT-0042]|nr:hypothetical protein BKA70DRAFT_1329933 [Coprinopsis sp. MPI-PUGE-AT-0042]KAH6916362.1 hypothetical protein BKA70DRAFT_1255468 [Coprinopsis sp. MPI-PUGE-AT-0042]